MWGQKAKEKIVLKNVAVWPVFEGDSMDRLLDRGFVPAGFANVPDPLPEEGSTVHFAVSYKVRESMETKWDYFSRGAVHRI